MTSDPSQQPVSALRARMIEDMSVRASPSSGRGEIVLDGFLGSGTTLIAAERTGRICRGLELDPLYVDTAIPLSDDPFVKLPAVAA